MLKFLIACLLLTVVAGRDLERRQDEESGDEEAGNEAAGDEEAGDEASDADWYVLSIDVFFLIKKINLNLD